VSRLGPVLALDVLIDNLTSLRKKTLLEIQESCPHPRESMRRAPYQGALSEARPDFLMCSECGLAEEGWGSFCAFEMHYDGESGIQEIPREEAGRLVRTFRTRREVSELNRKKWLARCREASRGDAEGVV